LNLSSNFGRLSLRLAVDYRFDYISSIARSVS